MIRLVSLLCCMFGAARLGAATKLLGWLTPAELKSCVVLANTFELVAIFNNCRALVAFICTRVLLLLLGFYNPAA